LNNKQQNINNMQFNEKKQGIVAGISLVIMAIAAGFAFGYAHNKLVTDSAENTLQNLISGKSLFYSELAGWSIIFITDLIVAISLYYFFRSISRKISLLTAWIRIIYTLFLGIAIVQLFKIVPLLSIQNPDISELVYYLHRFEKRWSVGLIIFGLHLVGLGYLSVKSKTVPRLLGYLLYFGGFGYTLLHGARQLNLFGEPVLESAENILAMPMALSEILFAFWLIYNGLRKSTSKMNTDK